VNCLPGLTGYWQVNGKNKTTFRQMIEMDLIYLRHMSIWFDLKIMLKTGTVMAGQLFESRQAPDRSHQKDSKPRSGTTILQTLAESAPKI
jgi:lipopolysaccharide/colanic/teichoic acid biosynthesis glycosyltransferase